MKFSEIGDKEVREYLDFLLRQYRLTDALWFLAVEDAFGTDAAIKLNEEVWATLGGLAAREIVKRFPLKGERVPRVLEALSYFPWTIIVKHEIEQTPDAARVRVRSCPPQEARVKMGRGEFPCKARHLAEWTNFIKEIDEGVQLHCLIAPPDPRPDDLWCEWELRPQE
jgi:hypothetical protein